MTVVAVLTCLVILALAGGAVLRAGLVHRALVRGQEHRLQAELLAESGVRRAIARLEVQHDYTGEVWSLSAAEIGPHVRSPAAGTAEKSDHPAAVVTIAVETVPSAAARRRIRVQADYPPGAPARSRHSRQVVVDLE
jgi:hypothetical protein